MEDTESLYGGVHLADLKLDDPVYFFKTENLKKKKKKPGLGSYKGTAGGRGGVGILPLERACLPDLPPGDRPSSHPGETWASGFTTRIQHCGGFP